MFARINYKGYIHTTK